MKKQRWTLLKLGKGAVVVAKGGASNHNFPSTTAIHRERATFSFNSWRLTITPQRNGNPCKGMQKFNHTHGGTTPATTHKHTRMYANRPNNGNEGQANGKGVDSMA